MTASGRPLDRVVVVGAGVAGLTALEALREEGFDRHVTLVGAEPRLPYDRPPLSKRVLDGSAEPSSVALRAAEDYDELDVDLVLGEPAVGVDRKRREVTTASGRLHPYDALVVATGVRPRTLGTADPAGVVRYLRTLDDAIRLRERLLHSPRLVVVGAGFLGVEVAVTARGLGCEVTVVDPEPVPMSRQVGPLIGGLLRERHQRRGIAFRQGVGVRRVEVDRTTTVVLDDGTSLRADLVVGAVGAEPAHEWLEGTGLVHPVGVLVDRRCRAAADVYVAGDVAAHPDPASPMGARRVEHRFNASEQGRSAATSLLGHDVAIPGSGYFWSDQGDLRIQAVGRFPAGGTTTVVSGDPEQDRFVALCVLGTQVVGVLAWNDARGLTRWRGRLGEPVEAVLAR